MEKLSFKTVGFVFLMVFIIFILAVSAKFFIINYETKHPPYVSYNYDGNLTCESETDNITNWLKCYNIISEHMKKKYNYSEYATSLYMNNIKDHYEK